MVGVELLVDVIALHIPLFLNLIPSPLPPYPLLLPLPLPIPTPLHPTPPLTPLHPTPLPAPLHPLLELILIKIIPLLIVTSLVNGPVVMGYLGRYPGG